MVSLSVCVYVNLNRWGCVLRGEVQGDKLGRNVLNKRSEVDSNGGKIRTIGGARMDEVGGVGKNNNKNNKHILNRKETNNRYKERK